MRSLCGATSGETEGWTADVGTLKLQKIVEFRSNRKNRGFWFLWSFCDHYDTDYEALKELLPPSYQSP